MANSCASRLFPNVTRAFENVQGSFMFRIFKVFRDEKGYSFHSCLYILERRGKKKKGKEKFKA